MTFTPISDKEAWDLIEQYKKYDPNTMKHNSMKFGVFCNCVAKRGRSALWKAFRQSVTGKIADCYKDEVSRKQTKEFPILTCDYEGMCGVGRNIDFKTHISNLVEGV